MNLIQQLEKSIYRINTASGSGTGFYNTESKLVITNFHVVSGNLEVSVENTNKDRFLAQVIYVNPAKDIAFLKVDDLPTPEKAIDINSDKKCHAKDSVMVLGFPYGMPFTVTEGIVSNPNQNLGGDEFIQTDAAINPGNSGGPVTDENGNLVGIATCKFDDADNVGFAIPAAIIKEELEIADEISKDNISVACPSCSGIIEEVSEHCPNCGSDIEESFFKAKTLSEFAIIIEKSIVQMGINPVLGRNGQEYWNFHKGTANIRIFVHDNNYLCVSSPLNKLPRTKLNELYEYILMEEMAPYRLSISDNQIYLSYIVHLSDVYSSYQDKILKDITCLAEKADILDDLFVEKFGAPMTHYSKTK